MDENAIKEALKLGSTDDHYDDKSLSKFGLGLKSASFSQGDVLKVISSDGTGFNKYEVSLPKVMEAKEYFAEKTEIDENESELIDTYLKEGKGTIIIISAIRLNNHPSVRNTIKELKTKVGVIYFYFLSESGINITIGDKKIDAIDPLFVAEANENGNLNENEWDGTEVQWIEKPKDFSFKAGQYCTIGTGNIERAYSIVSSPHEDTLELFVDNDQCSDKELLHGATLFPVE